MIEDGVESTHTNLFDSVGVSRTNNNNNNNFVSTVLHSTFERVNMV